MGNQCICDSTNIMIWESYVQQSSKPVKQERQMKQCAKKTEVNDESEQAQAIEGSLGSDFSLRQRFGGRGRTNVFVEQSNLMSFPIIRNSSQNSTSTQSLEAVENQYINCHISDPYPKSSHIERLVQRNVHRTN